MLPVRSVLYTVKKTILLENVKMTLSGSCFSTIPIIDISPLVKLRSSPHELEDPKVQQVVKKIDDACRKVGFFYVQGHGVPVDMMNHVRKLAQEFFRLSVEEKYKIKMTSASGWRGYQTLGENVTKGVPDLHESVDFFHDYNGDFPAFLLGHPLNGRNRWPETPVTFRPIYNDYLSMMQELGRTIMQGISLALTGARDTFDGDRAGNPYWLLRVIGYPPLAKKVAELGCGEHTDYGLLTLVNQDNDIQALQVKNQAGEWIWANPIPGTFVVNLGDMLKIWSNGLYMPTVHRVLNNNSKYRVSVPYFYEPNFEAHVEPLDVCKQRSGGQSKFASVVYGDHLTNKVLNNFK